MEGWNGLLVPDRFHGCRKSPQRYVGIPHLVTSAFLSEQCRAWTFICPFNDMTLDGTLGVQSLLDCPPLPQKRPNHLNMALSCA